MAETFAETKTAFTGDAEEVLELLNDLLAKRVLTEEGADGGDAHHQALLQILRGLLNGQKRIQSPKWSVKGVQIINY